MEPMKLRAPHLPADTVPNRFGWRHEGPGPQWPDDEGETVEELFPAESFNHPALKRRPPYDAQRQGTAMLSFTVRKGCAGLAHGYHREPEKLYRRIRHGWAQAPADCRRTGGRGHVPIRWGR